MNYVNFNVLIKKTKDLLIKKGANEFSAESVAIGLSETSLRGVDSHGIRLLPHYINALTKGRINGSPDFKIINSYSSLIGLDADNAFGHAAGFKSIEIGMDLADKHGIAAVSVINSSHPGAMASFALKAAKNGFCCFSFTHADSLVQSFNSNQKYFGTNPICFAAPRNNEEPFCLDMAPTFIPWNKILDCKEKGIELDSKVAVDQKGNPTTDPSQAWALLPIGGYKGYGLAFMVEILCGILSGMNFGPNIPTMYGDSLAKKRKLGQFYIVFKSDVNVNSNQFSKSLELMSKEVRNQSPLEPGSKVLVPNDPQIKFMKERLKSGIPINQEIYKLLFTIL